MKEEENYQNFDNIISPLVIEYVTYFENLEMGNPFSKEEITKILSGTAPNKLVNKFIAVNSRAIAIHGKGYDHHNMLGFVPHYFNRGTSKTDQGSTLSGAGINPMPELLDELKKIALQGMVDMADDASKQAVEAITNAAKDLFKQNNTTKTTSILTNGFGDSNSFDANHILTTPLNVTYNSGVKTTMYPNRMNVPTRNINAPDDHGDGRVATADLAAVIQRVPPGNEFSDIWWTDVFIPNLQAKAQSKVGFNVSANTNFSYVKVVDYFNLLFIALAKYFFVANTFSVIAGQAGEDVARSKIRMMFKVEDLQVLSLLKERLDNLPIPPKMIERSSFLYSLYKTSPSSDSSDTIGFVPVGLQATGTDNASFNSIDLGLLQTVKDLGSLIDSGTHPLSKTIDFMARVFPSWVATTVGATQIVPLHSHEFNAIFLASPAIQSSYLSDGEFNTFYLPQYSNATDTQQFTITGEFIDTLIGDQQATSGAHVNGVWSGNLVPVPSAFGTDSLRLTNRYTFSNRGNGPEWISSNQVSNLVNGWGQAVLRQPYTHIVAGSDWYSMPKFGSVSLRGNTVDSMSQPNIDWLREMFDLDVPDGNQNSSSRGRGRGRNNRGEESGK
jgi:hypothetical protein